MTAQQNRAQDIIDGIRPAKKARFLKTSGQDLRLDTASLERARDLAGLKGYVTNITAEVMPATQIIASYHDLWVRREALVDRGEVKDLRRCSYRSRTVKLRAA